MAGRRWLATVLAYLTLELGSLLGVPVRLDQIEEMTRLLNQTLVTRVERRESGGDPPIPGQRRLPALD
jgi:hypothetical protein